MATEMMLLLQVVGTKMAAAEACEQYQQLYPLYYYCKLLLDHALALTYYGNYTKEYRHKISSDHHRSSSKKIRAVDLDTSCCFSTFVMSYKPSDLMMMSSHTIDAGLTDLIFRHDHDHVSE